MHKSLGKNTRQTCRYGCKNCLRSTQQPFADSTNSLASHEPKIKSEPLEVEDRDVFDGSLDSESDTSSLTSLDSDDPLFDLEEETLTRGGENEARVSASLEKLMRAWRHRPDDISVELLIFLDKMFDSWATKIDLLSKLPHLLISRHWRNGLEPLVHAGSRDAPLKPSKLQVKFQFSRVSPKIKKETKSSREDEEHSTIKHVDSIPLVRPTLNEDDEHSTNHGDGSPIITAKERPLNEHDQSFNRGDIDALGTAGETPLSENDGLPINDVDTNLHSIAERRPLNADEQVPNLANSNPLDRTEERPLNRSEEQSISRIDSSPGPLDGPEERPPNENEEQPISRRSSQLLDRAEKRPLNDIEQSFSHTDSFPFKRQRLLQGEQSTGDRKRWACPFYRREPHLYCIATEFGDFRACAKSPGFSELHRVKEHIYKCHSPKYCERCFVIFKTEDELTTHRRSSPICEIKPSGQINGITSAQKALLKPRNRSKKSEEERWGVIYKTCFPNDEEVPSPYYIHYSKEVAEIERNVMEILKTAAQQPQSVDWNMLLQLVQEAFDATLSTHGFYSSIQPPLGIPTPSASDMTADNSGATLQVPAGNTIDEYLNLDAMGLNSCNQPFDLFQGVETNDLHPAEAAVPLQGYPSAAQFFNFPPQQLDNDHSGPLNFNMPETEFNGWYGP